MKKNVRKLLVRMLLLFVPFLFLFLLTEYKLRQLTSSYAKKKRDFEAVVQEVEVLILGSSQSLQALNPSFIHCPAYNLANVSQTLYYDVALATRYLPQLPRLKTVIIPISYFSFTEELKDSEPNREYFYYHYWGIRAEHLPWLDLRKISLMAVYTPLTSLKLAIAKTGNPEEIDQWGWKKVGTTDLNAISNEKAKARIQLHETGSEENRANNLKRLTQLVELLRRHRVEPVFITTPCYKTYYENISPSMHRSNENDIRKLCQKFNLRYFNYFADTAFKKEDFSDNDHLNAVGAAKFSKLLEEQIHPCQ